jgi:Tol biopolymer transport system component
MAAALAIAAATLFWRDRSAGAPARVVTYTLDDKADLSALSIQPVGLVVSPDGSRIFSQTPANERQLFVRRLDQPAATLLPNTELGRVLFIAPDGTWVGFGTLNTLKRVSLVDGTVVTICQTETVPSTAAVSAGGDIVFSMGLALWIVPADGGTPRPLTVLAPTEQAQAVSGFLPDGRTLLFTNWLADRSRIETLDIADGTRNVLLDQAAGGQCISNGYLLFARDGALLAAPLDLASRSTGAAVRVLDRIQTGMLGIPKLGVSRDGSVLAYAEPLRASLVWVSRTGLETPLDLPPRQYQFVAVSGDGRRVAFAEESSVSVADLSRSGSARVSSERFIYGSLGWSPGDAELSYSALHSLVARTIDGTRPSRQLGSGLPGWKLAPSWSSDGKTIAYTAYFGDTNADIYVEPVDGSTPPRSLVATNAYDAGPQVSPDSRFVAYASAETGKLEVYVTAFPGPGPKWQVSTNGGTHVRWSRDGRELFYRNGDDFMAVPVTTRQTFTPGKPVLLFRGRYSYGSGVGLPTYDVAPDGRFLMIKNEDETAERPRIIINWADILQRIVAGR